MTSPTDRMGDMRPHERHRQQVTAFLEDVAGLRLNQPGTK
jgi:hypothetical protein